MEGSIIGSGERVVMALGLCDKHMSVTGMESVTKGSRVPLLAWEMGFCRVIMNAGPAFSPKFLAVTVNVGRALGPGHPPPKRVRQA